MLLQIKNFKKSCEPYADILASCLDSYAQMCMIRTEYFILFVLLLVRFQVLRTIASTEIPSSNYFFTCISFVIEKFFNNQFLLRFNRATSMDKKCLMVKKQYIYARGKN